MSETPDRLGHPFHGGTGFGRALSCEYPGAASSHSHADLAGDHHRDHDESASSPAPSDDFSDFFDWDGYERGDDAVTDVTAQSDAPSEGPPAAQPLIQIPGGPAAVAPSHEDEDDVPMLDAPSEKPPHVWPSLSGAQPPRDLNIHVDSSPSPSPSPSPSADMPSPPSRKRTRTVKNPEMTSKVRDIGACYRCRMSKAGCGDDPVCGACMKQPYSSCIRKLMPSMVSDSFFRWNWNDPHFCLPSRDQFVDDGAFPVFISMSPDPNSPSLQVMVSRFVLPNQRDQGQHGTPLLGVNPDQYRSGLLEVKIQDWMEKQVLFDEEDSFEAEMDRLLVKFARRLEIAPLPIGQRHRTLFMSDLRKMRCMWRFWSCKDLFLRWHPGSQGSPLDSGLASVHDFLRKVTAVAISELERKVLVHIETYVVKSERPWKKSAELEPETQCTLNITRWLSLWQVMLMYRQSLRWVLEQQQHANAPPLHLSVMPDNDKKYTFRETTKELLEIVIVIYSGNFLKKTTVCNTRDTGPLAFGEDWGLCATYQRAWQHLPEFYQQVLRQISPADELFVESIVKKEVVFLANGRPARK